MISAGRVLIMPKGTFDPTVQYEMLDLVDYNGSSYFAKSSTIGNLPTNKTYWQLSAYGASSTNIAANFATIETNVISSNNYAVGEYLVDVDSKLCEVIIDIAVGDQIILNTNVKETTVEEMIEGVLAKIETLRQETKSLIPIKEIDSSLDLNSLISVGEYTKKLTSFFVTNAPLGIDSIPTAVFRLTVEKGSDGNRVHQSILTDDNKTYSRSYKNSVWSPWVQAETSLTWNGTSTDWNALSQYEKALYTYVVLTDD